MTGTSIDGIDAALVHISGRGVAMRARLMDHAHHSLGSCAVSLRSLAHGEALTAREISAAAAKLADRHITAISRLKGHRQATLICVHGQTVYHKPPLSWQLINPAPIAQAFGVRVVHDLRSADIAAGGQGAPLTPLADYVLFRGTRARSIVNLGGFCNLTILPGRGGSIKDVRGLDACVCNLLLDRIARDMLGSSFDRGGRNAMRGNIAAKPRDQLFKLLKAQQRASRSLGTGDECGTWIHKHSSHLSPQDMLATATDAVGMLIAESCEGTKEIVLAGGGAKNRALSSSIMRHAKLAQVIRTDDLGIPIEAREAACFAVLGALAEDGIPVSLPHVTRAKKPPKAGSFTAPP